MNKQADNAQEAVEKFEQSKRELDEVVAQMESLVSQTSGRQTCLSWCCLKIAMLTRPSKSRKALYLVQVA